MRFELKEVSICAEKEFELIRITDPVREFVAQTGVKNGVVYVITEHTTTGIMVNESLPCVEKDIIKLGSAADIYFCEYDGIKNRKYMIYVMGE